LLRKIDTLLLAAGSFIKTKKHSKKAATRCLFLYQVTLMTLIYKDNL